jgi:Protein of unknown function (DUF3631)
MPKLTPAQRFHNIFKRWMAGATEAERATAEKKMDEWLAKNGKTRADISSIVAQAVADDLAANPPPPPPSDPRDGALHPFDDPAFTPAGLVEGIVKKYVTMQWHASVIYALWICFTHVYTRFEIAPRIALTSEEPDAGKSTARKIASHLVFRPNEESLGTAASIRDFLDQGPGTVLLDEVDHLDPEARLRLRRIFNLGHEHGAKISLQDKGRRRLFNIYAPMLVAGIKGFLTPTMRSRSLALDMEPYSETTKPERRYDHGAVEDLNAVYSFLRHWAAGAKLAADPEMPAGLLRRFADNVRGLISVADSCGREWGRIAREAVLVLSEQEKAKRPHIAILRHGLEIFSALELEQIASTKFNKELRRLDLPDARWTRYRGANGADYPHPLEMHEQAALLARAGIHSMRVRPPGERQCRGYKLNQFQHAWSEHGGAPATDEGRRGRLRLITPRPD